MDAKEWIVKLEEFREYFQNATLPAGPVKIGNHATIGDLSKYINTNLTVASQKPGNYWFSGAMQRLQELKDILEQAKA